MNEEELLKQMVLSGHPPPATKMTIDGLDPDLAQQPAIVEILQRFHVKGQTERFISPLMRHYRTFPGHRTFDSRKIGRIVRRLPLYLGFIEVSDGRYERALFVKEPVVTVRSLRKCLKDENEVNRFLEMLKKKGFPLPIDANRKTIRKGSGKKSAGTPAEQVKNPKPKQSTPHSKPVGNIFPVGRGR